MSAPRKASATLELDGTTLADLEVRQTLAGEPGLLYLLDGTRTRRGAEALWDRLRAPSADPAVIRSVQGAVRYLGPRPLMRLSDEFLGAVDRYLRSNITLVSGEHPPSRLTAAWLALRWRGLFRELRQGVESVRELVGWVGEALGPDLVELPAALDGLVCEAREICAALPAGSGLSAVGVLAADLRLRGSDRPRVERLLEILGELDALQAMAEANRREGWTFPEIVDGPGPHLTVEGLVHPTLAEPVPNALVLSEEGNLVFLSGPNMAGKTTFLRSLGLAVLLAQVGLGVPADRMRIAPVQVLFTSLNPRDNLRAGLSYFLAEVRRVRAAAEHLARGRTGIFLFDEVFKGTNVRDALEASGLVMEGFARRRQAASIFASHLSELVPRLESVPGVRFRCFEGEVQGGTARFSYRLREGHSDQRFGLLLLRQEGVPELLGFRPAG